ncbi:ABC transporter substrate-binding protein [Ruania rhizosphaerae]|uniref:ABC transporter substrate-binding protein n=1 Tax=Ruania rhizosphaerae TaxID=1840413 RepID=UPI001F4896ED|nr:extracellular solute-binding protein [Ruania rhizosphaerae]
MRFVSCAAAASILLTVAACASDGEAGDDADQSLEVWARSDEASAVSWQFMLDEFTEQTGIEVEYQAVQEFDTQLQARASQGDLPDLLVNDAGSLGNYVAQGLVLPVDQAAIEGNDEVPQRIWDESIGPDGELYGVPFSRQASITILRKDWRENLGYDVPTTWDELTELAEAFATEDPDGNGEDDTYGMVVPGSAQSGYIYRWANPYILQAGGDALERSEDGTFSVVFDSPEVNEAVEWVQEQFCTEGVTVPGSINLTTADTPFFQQGTAGIYSTGPYNISTFSEAVGAENVEIIPAPAGPEGTTAWAEGENIYFGASSDKLELQQQLASFLISAEAQEIGMSNEENDEGVAAQAVVRIPVNENVDAAQVTGDERLAVAQEAYADSEPFPWSIDYLPYRQIVADGLNAIAADCNADVAEGVTSIAAQLQEQLERDEFAG